MEARISHTFPLNSLTFLNLYESPNVAKVIATMLGKEGYKVCMYDNEHLPQDINKISSVSNEELDGLELIRYVRKSLKPSNKPLIIRLRKLIA